MGDAPVKKSLLINFIIMEAIIIVILLILSTSQMIDLKENDEAAKKCDAAQKEAQSIAYDINKDLKELFEMLLPITVEEAFSKTFPKLDFNLTAMDININTSEIPASKIVYVNAKDGIKLPIGYFDKEHKFQSTLK